MAQFKNQDLLTYSQMKTLLDENGFPDEKASVVANSLLKYCLIARKNLYLLDYEHMVYKLLASDDDSITMEMKNLVPMLIKLSYLALSEDQRDMIDKCKLWKVVRSENGTNAYYNALYKKLSKDDLKFDADTKYEMHFRNGYIDLKTNELKTREFGKHYVTKYINRDYTSAKKKDIDYMYSIINKIWTNIEDRDYNLNQLGRAITGDSAKEQTNIFWLGTGSSGKSLIMSLMKSALSDCYVKELGSSVFEKGNKPDKTLNEFDTNPVIRIAWISELSGKSMNVELFKNFCEGEVQTNKLYKDGSYSISFTAKLFCTSNEMPSIRQDSGVQRRILAYYFTSEFVDDKKLVNENKHIYLKNKELLNQIKENEGLLNAIVDILVQHAIIWQQKPPPLPKSYQNAKSKIISANDKTQDFIDKYLVITGDKVDRIGKRKMLELYLEMYPDKKGCEVQHILSELQDKKIQYDAQKTVKSMKGCFIGVRLKTSENHFNRQLAENLGEKFIDPEEYDKEVQNNIVSHLQKQIDDQRAQIADQQEYIRKLEFLVQDINLPKKSVSTKKITTKEVVTVVEKPAPEFPRKIKKVKSSDFDFDGILTIG